MKPLRPEALTEAVAAHLSAGRADQGEALVRAALSETPDDANALYLLARITLGRRQPSEAVRLLQRALNLGGDTAAYHGLLGQALMAQGRLEDALEGFRRAIELEPDWAEGRFLLGTALGHLGRLEDALGAFGKAAELAPGNAAVWTNLGVSFTRLGRHEDAIKSLRRALALDPRNPECHHNIAVALMSQQRFTEAERHLGNALSLAPGHRGTGRALGEVLFNQKKYGPALPYLDAALEDEPDNHDLLLAAARCREAAGQPERAAEAYARALRLRPGSIGAMTGLAIVETNRGRLDKAVELYEAALDLEPDNPRILGNLARIRRFAPEDPLIAAMTRLAASGGIAFADRVQLEFALDKAFDDTGNYDEAFRHYETANRLHASAKPFDVGAFQDFIERTTDVFDAAYFAERDSWGAADQTPVFIVGMGRSGTSLVEQILASHADGYGAGELEEIERLALDLARPGSAETYPEAARTLGRQDAKRLGDSYVAELRALAPDALRISDKMPLNFQYLGFIATILPASRIIHCRRDPLDTCLSLYFQHFADDQPYAYNLEHLGLYYRAYERLMDHWRKTLPLRVHDIVYEDLIARPEEEIRKLIAFCGLPWDERCLAFHETDRAVRTASLWQVRQPIHTKSVGRGRHYEAHLAPLKKALGRR
jgi:tetratricopeptide (TPR) repeat protein